MSDYAGLLIGHSSYDPWAAVTNYTTSGLNTQKRQNTKAPEDMQPWRLPSVDKTSRSAICINERGPGNDGNDMQYLMRLLWKTAAFTWWRCRQNSRLSETHGTRVEGLQRWKCVHWQICDSVCLIYNDFLVRGQGFKLGQVQLTMTWDAFRLPGLSRSSFQDSSSSQEGSCDGVHLQGRI